MSLCAHLEARVFFILSFKTQFGCLDPGRSRYQARRQLPAPHCWIQYSLGCSSAPVARRKSCYPEQHLGGLLVLNKMHFLCGLGGALRAHITKASSSLLRGKAVLTQERAGYFVASKKWQLVSGEVIPGKNKRTFKWKKKSSSRNLSSLVKPQVSFCIIYSRSTFFFFFGPLIQTWTSLVAQMVKHLCTMWETWVRSLGWEDSLEKEMATHCTTLA